MKRSYPKRIETPLQFACKESNNTTVEFLLDFGANPYTDLKEIDFFEVGRRLRTKTFVTFEYTSTVLTLSVAYRNFELTKILLDRGIEDINSDSFAIACYAKNLEMAELICSRTQVSREKVKKIFTDIIGGGVTQHLDVILFLIERFSSKERYNAIKIDEHGCFEHTVQVWFLTKPIAQDWIKNLSKILFDEDSEDIVSMFFEVCENDYRG